MCTSETPWPAYDLGSRDHLHAIGTLIAAWNKVEAVYASLFIAIIQPPLKLNVAITAFELMGNDSRWQFINDECARYLQPDESDHVQHFLKCAAICKENRNAIAHAKVAPSANGLLNLARGRSKPSNLPRNYWLDVPSLRQMADETYAIGEYGEGIASFAICRRWPTPPEFQMIRADIEQMTLPEKPPLPRKWHLHSRPDPGDAPRLPQPSPE